MAAIARLVATIRDSENGSSDQVQAIKALGNISRSEANRTVAIREGAVGALTAQLSGASSASQEEALKVLSALATFGGETSDALREQGAIEAIAQMLAAVGENEAAAMFGCRALVSAATSRAANIPFVAAAVPALARLLSRDNDLLRTQAAWTLALVFAADGGSTYCSGESAKAFRENGGYPALAKMLQGRDYAVLYRVIDLMLPLAAVAANRDDMFKEGSLLALLELLADLKTPFEKPEFQQGLLLVISNFADSDVYLKLILENQGRSLDIYVRSAYRDVQLAASRINMNLGAYRIRAASQAAGWTSAPATASTTATKA